MISCDVCGKSNKRMLCTFSQRNRGICVKCGTVQCEKLGHPNCRMTHYSEAYKQWNAENKQLVSEESQRINDIQSW